MLFRKRVLCKCPLTSNTTHLNYSCPKASTNWRAFSFTSFSRASSPWAVSKSMQRLKKNRIFLAGSFSPIARSSRSLEERSFKTIVILLGVLFANTHLHQTTYRNRRILHPITTVFPLHYFKTALQPTATVLGLRVRWFCPCKPTTGPVWRGRSSGHSRTWCCPWWDNGPLAMASIYCTRYT